MPRVIIELDIEGSSDDAFTVVDRLLDVGVLQEAIGDYHLDHDDDCGQLRVTRAISRGADEVAESAAPVAAPRVPCDANDIPLTDWPHLRDYNAGALVAAVGGHLIASRADGNELVFSMFLDRRLEVEVHDNGGELKVVRVERSDFGQDVPLTCHGRPVGPLTLAYRVRATILGNPIDYTLDIDRDGDVQIEIPESMFREVCATRLAEAAHLGPASEREALLRASYHLSHPDDDEEPLPAPSRTDLALASDKLRQLAVAMAGTPVFEAPPAIAQKTLVARAARGLMADVLRAGAQLLLRKDKTE